MLKETKDIAEFMDVAAKGGPAYIFYEKENGELTVLDFGFAVTKRLNLPNAKYVCDTDTVNSHSKSKRAYQGAGNPGSAKINATSSVKERDFVITTAKNAAGRTMADRKRNDDPVPPEPVGEDGDTDTQGSHRGGRRRRIDRDQVVELKNSGLTPGEIAEKLGCSVPGVNTVIRELKAEGRI